MDPEEEKLRRQVEQQAKRMRQAEHDRPTLLAQTTYLGTLGLLIALPIVAGAYLGSWLDRQMAGYSVRWTVSLVLVGVAVGAVNVYLFIKKHE